MGIWAASVRRWIADLLVGHGLDGGAVGLPWEPQTDSVGSVGRSPDDTPDDA
jgi:hypothetical protein